MQELVLPSRHPQQTAATMSVLLWGHKGATELGTLRWRLTPQLEHQLLSPGVRGWRALTGNCGSVTLWLGATVGEGLPKPAAQCMHLGLPCEKHQDAACRENAAREIGTR